MIKHIIIYIIISIIVLSLLGLLMFLSKNSKHIVNRSTVSTTSTSDPYTPGNPTGNPTGPFQASTAPAVGWGPESPTNYPGTSSDDPSCKNDDNSMTCCGNCLPLCNNYCQSHNFNAPNELYYLGMGLYPPPIMIPVIQVDSTISDSGATLITLHISDTTLSTYIFIGVNPYFITTTSQVNNQTDGVSFTAVSTVNDIIVKYNDYWIYAINYDISNPRLSLCKSFTLCAGKVSFPLLIGNNYKKNPDYTNPKTWIIYANYGEDGGPNWVAGSPTAAECAQ